MHSLPRCVRARTHGGALPFPLSRRGVAARSRGSRGERLDRTVRNLSRRKARPGREARVPAHRCGGGVAAGSKADRAALRAQYLKHAGQKTFPIVRAQSPTAATSESLVHSHARESATPRRAQQPCPRTSRRSRVWSMRSGVCSDQHSALTTFEIAMIDRKELQRCVQRCRSRSLRAVAVAGSARHSPPGASIRYRRADAEADRQA